MFTEDPLFHLEEVLKELFTSAYPGIASLRTLQSLIPGLFSLFPSYTQEITTCQHVLANAATLLSCKNRDREFSICYLSYLRQTVFLLEPLLELGKSDSRFLTFLLSHHEQLALLTHEKYPSILLKKLHPEGWATIEPLLHNVKNPRQLQKLLNLIHS